MNRRTLLVLALTTACKSRDGVGGVVPFIDVADPGSANQLVSGFHGIEQNRFRWTAGRFSVLLRPPSNASRKGARLYLQFFIADPVMNQLKEVKLAAVINGTPLPPETYTKAGPYQFRRDIEPRLIGGEDAVTVNFSLDKALPPGADDQRELGLAVEKVGFEKR